MGKKSPDVVPDLPAQQFNPVISRPEFEFNYVTIPANPTVMNKREVTDRLKKNWEIISAVASANVVHYVFARAKVGE